MDKSNGAKYKLGFGSPYAPKPFIEKVKPQSRPSSIPVGKSLNPNFKLQLRNPTIVDAQVDSWKEGLIKQKQKVAEATRPTSQVSSTSTASESSTTPSSTMTTSSTTYSSSNQPITSSDMPQNTNGNNRNSGGRQNNSSRYEAIPKALYKPKDNAINQNDTQANYWFPDKASEKIGITEKLPTPLYLDQSEVARLDGNDITHKLMINQSSFAEMFQVTEVSNPILYRNLQNIYDRISIDLLNSARGSLYDVWTFPNFMNAMYWSAHGFEALYSYDSIVGYDPKQDDFYNINKTAEAYRYLFTSSENLNSRQGLRAALKGSWLPPDIAALMRWFYQYYRTSELSQSAFFRYVPFDTYIPVDGVVTSLAAKFDAIRSNLVTATNQKIYAMLTKAFSFGGVRTIPACASEAVYDDMMFEIFVNDPVMHRNASNDASYVYPIGFTDTRNEIPYFQNRNPHQDDNGLSFGLQYIATAASTNGNILPTTWTGLRKITASGTAARFTNRWTIGFNSSNKVHSLPRHTTLNMVMGTSDAHVYALNGTTVTWLSKCNTGFQKVYYNNASAPTSSSGRLLESLFGLLPNS